MHDMLSFLDSDAAYQALQEKMKIAPITTMTGGTAYAPLFQNTDFHLGIVVSDLVRIKAYLDAGWDVLGWQNQKCTANHPYAVDGGITSLPPTIDSMIQKTLIQYHTGFTV